MDHQSYYDDFSLLLDAEDKEGAFHYALALLESGKLDVISLYTDILTPAVNNISCSMEEKRLCIWKEHVQTAIVRTIVESCFPFVIEERQRRNPGHQGTAAVLCPPEENHDLGARMIADFLTICGYKTIFVGSNTPHNDFVNAVDVIEPEVVAISVSNFYHLIVTKKIIKDLRERTTKPLKIIVGGFAFDSNKEHIANVGADDYAQSFQEIYQIIQSNKEGSGVQL